MICKNCGAELPDGTLICSRCGARQSAGGNGGSGNGGGKKSSGGFGGRNLGKILAAVLGVCVVVGVSIFFTSKNTQAQDSMFTDNINFDKNALTVINENTLRLRDLPNNQVFSVSGLNGFVDVNVVDENQLKVNYEVKKDKNNYLIAPNGQWDNKHTYTLTVSGDTHFTDEALFRFNKIIFTIHKEDVAIYKYNENIKNLVENPNQSVETGDIIVTRDDNGRLMCREVMVAEEGKAKEIDLPDLFDVFDELEMVGSQKINLADYLSEGNKQKEVLQNFVNSSIFQAFVMSTYAERITDVNEQPEVHIWEWGESGKGVINQIMDDDEKIGQSFINSASVSVEFKNKEIERGKFKVKFTPDWNEEHVKLTFKIISENESNNKTKNSEFGFSFEWNKPEIKYNFSKTSKQLEAYFTNSYKYSMSYGNGAEIENNGLRTLLESSLDSNPVEILNIPVPTTIPAIYFYLKVTVDPKITGESNFHATFSGECNVKVGTTFINGIGFVPDKSIDDKNSAKNDSKLELGIDGEAKFESPLKVELGVVFSVIPDKYTKTIKNYTKHGLLAAFIDNIEKFAPAAFIDLYGQLGPVVELKGKAEFEISNKTIESKKFVKEFDIIERAGLGAGVKVGIELRIKFFGFKANLEEVLFDNTYYAFYVGCMYKATSSEADWIIPIPPVHSLFTIGDQEFLVLIKEPDKALIIANDGVDCVPYNKPFLFFGNSKTWSSSYLREYLNGDYRHTLNPILEQSLIKTIVRTENEEATQDEIFILSKSEFEDLVPDDYRSIKPSDLANKKKPRIAIEDDSINHRKKGYVPYWLRDALPNDSLNAMAVFSDGTVFGSNDEEKLFQNKLPKNSNDICVRPAMYVNYTDDYCGYDLAQIGITSKNVNPYINPSVKFEQSVK